MSYPLLKSYSRKPYLHVPGQPYTASTRFSQEWGRCLHDNIIIGQNLLRKFGQIPSVTEWREIFSFEISDELSDFDNITWEDTGSTISVKRMKHLHQMAVDLASSHPVGLFEDSWIEADNVPPVTPDGTAWEAAVSCLGNLWVSESTSESIGIYCLEEENERALYRLRWNDPYLKEMTLELPRYSRTGTERQHEMILQAFDAIATSSSLEMLDINVQQVCGGVLFIYHSNEVTDRARRALSLNTSLKDIRITAFYWLKDTLDLVLASPNLQALTVRCEFKPSITDLTNMAQVLRINRNLHSLTVERFYMDSDLGIAFAAIFHGNEAIKTLMMRQHAVKQTGAVSFVEALPHDHNLETIIFDGNSFDDDHVLSIVRTLCHKHLKTLSLLNTSRVSQDGYERIVQTLKENDHSFTKLDLFHDSEDSPWQNKIRLDIDMLTWENRVQVEKDMWVDRFLEQHTSSREMLFLALERAKKVDNERFSKAPNLLLHLIKESPDLIAQAICNGI